MLGPAPKVIVEPKFDLTTHRRDKYGKVIEINPYRMHCIGPMKGFERPIGSKNLWYENNEPMGRLVETRDEKTKVTTLSFDLGAPHLEWTAPLTADQQIARESAEMKATNSALQAELAAMKAEREADQKAFNDRIAKLEAATAPAATAAKGKS